MLLDVQKQLEQRFASLATGRSALKYPVYALEHGLADDTLTALKVTASQTILHQAPSPTHWLVWTALGAEAGYGYSGDEFWPAMDVRSGEWRSHYYRQSLREFYRRFQLTYGGPIPTGRWADQFSIIAWPISHAILPCYLQTRFARHLYELRYDIRHRASGSGAGLGEFLFQSYHGNSSRFRDFLQQTALTEQIVLALRDENVADVVPRIDQSVLGRIVADLESQPLAKSYLKDARRVIQSTSLRVSSRLQLAAQSLSASHENGSVGPLRMRLAARRQSDGGFILGIQLPDVLTAIDRKLAMRQAFDGVRVRFVGENERPVPASVLLTLSGKQRRLDAFPDANIPVFTIESGPSQLSSFLETLSRIEEKPCWVLRRQSDGLFREVIGGHVRSGQEYLILSRFDVPQELLQANDIENVTIETVGLKGYALKTPSNFSDAQIAALRKLNIGTVMGVRIDPVGLLPAPGHNGGPPQWLSTESVALRLAADFAATKFLVGLDGESPQEVAASNAQALLMFDHLEPGAHSISVSVPATDGHTSRTETFSFEIVSPRPWIAAMRERAGFRLTLQPSNATFEQTITGMAAVNMMAPDGRTVHWSFETYNTAGHLDGSLVIGNTKVGLPPASLVSMLQRARIEHEQAIDDSYRIDLVAQVDELGRQALCFHHEVEPLRWKLNPSTGEIRLIDETDHEEAVTVHEYPLDSPMETREIDTGQALAGLAVKPPGSLFIAAYRQRLYPLFISRPPNRLRQLSDLGLSQSITLPAAQAQGMIDLIASLRRWEGSKAVGYLGSLRKATTLARLKAEIAVLACGKEFVDELTSDRPDRAERAQKKVGGSPGFGLRAKQFEWPDCLTLAQVAFEEIASTYGVERDPKWSHAALMLAVRPLRLKEPEGDDEFHFFTELLSRRNLIRGAFLADARLSPSVEARESA